MRKLLAQCALILAAPFSLITTTKAQSKQGKMENKKEKAVFKDNAAKLNSILADVKTLDKSMADSSVSVDILLAMNDLFQPKNHPCVVGKFKGKLKKKMDDIANYLPEDFKPFLSRFPKRAVYVRGLPLPDLLHKVRIHTKEGVKNDYVYTAPTRINFDKSMFQATSESFSYTLDCSGYMSSVLHASAGIDAADIKTALGATTKENRSMMVTYFRAFSPLYEAVFASHVKLDTPTRIGVLEAMLLLPYTSEDDVIEVAVCYDLICASKNGNSGFNGEASMDGKAGGSFGIGKVEISANGSVNFTRKTEFSTYDNYILDKDGIDPAEPITIKLVRKKLSELKTTK